MANEVEWTYASQVTLEGSGASAGSGTFLAADDAALSDANHYNYPLGDFVLKCSFAAAVAAGSAVYLYRQDLNIDSTNDAPAPTATNYEQTLVGVFNLPQAGSESTNTLYYPCVDVPLTKECQFSIKNAANQTLSAGWTLKVTPKTYAPGA